MRFKVNLLNNEHNRPQIVVVDASSFVTVGNLTMFFDDDGFVICFKEDNIFSIERIPSTFQYPRTDRGG
jgi:hypothetical protein